MGRPSDRHSKRDKSAVDLTKLVSRATTIETYLTQLRCRCLSARSPSINQRARRSVRNPLIGRGRRASSAQRRHQSAQIKRQLIMYAPRPLDHCRRRLVGRATEKSLNWPPTSERFFKLASMTEGNIGLDSRTVRSIWQTNERASGENNLHVCLLARRPGGSCVSAAQSQPRAQSIALNDND